MQGSRQGGTVNGVVLCLGTKTCKFKEFRNTDKEWNDDLILYLSLHLVVVNVLKVRAYFIHIHFLFLKLRRFSIFRINTTMTVDENY